MNDDSLKSSSDPTELVDIEDIRRQAESLKIIQNAREQKKSHEAADHTEQLSKEQLLRLANLAKAHSASAAALPAQSSAPTAGESVPAHLRPPAPPPNLTDLARTEKINAAAFEKSAAPQNEKAQPDWLRASKAVDLGRPESGAPKAIDGERHKLEIPRKEEARVESAAQEPKNSSKKQAFGVLLAVVLGIAVLGTLFFSKSPAEKPSLAEPAENLVLKAQKSPSEPEMAGSLKAPSLAKHPVRLELSTEAQPAENKAYLEEFALVLKEQGIFAVKGKTNVARIALEPLVVNIQHRKRGDYVRAECSALLAKASQGASEEFGATASIQLAKETEEEARNKSVHQCLQKLGRKLLRGLKDLENLP